MNINPVAQVQAICDEFTQEFGIRPVANDYNYDPAIGALHTNAVHDLFQPFGAKPVFLIINCVSNSPSHGRNTLLLNDNTTPEDWDATAAQWRARIDSVQAPPPQLADLRLTNGAVRFTLPGQRGRTNQVLASTDLVNWSVLTSFHGTNGPIIFRDTNILSTPHRFYRLRRL